MYYTYNTQHIYKLYYNSRYTYDIGIPYVDHARHSQTLYICPINRVYIHQKLSNIPRNP